MKLRTKTVIFYSLVTSTLILSGVGLGLLFGLGRIHEISIKTITSDQTNKYQSEHFGLVSGAVITSFAAVSLVVSAEFGLSYFLTLRFVKSRKEKLKKAALSNITATDGEEQNNQNNNDGIQIIEPTNEHENKSTSSFSDSK